MRRYCATITLLSLATAAFAQTATTATTRPAIEADLAGTVTIDLWPDGLPTGATPATQPESIRDRIDRNGARDRTVRDVSRPTLVAFPVEGARLTAGVVVVPGGGYAGQVFDREGYFVAEQLRRRGLVAFVLKYRLPNGTPPSHDRLPAPAEDVIRSVQTIRATATRWNVDPQRVGVLGFSAGGHAAGTAATQFDLRYAKDDAIAQQPARPDFAGLIYAVASMRDPLAHAGSRQRLLGPMPDEALLDRFSTARRVTSRTPPLFLVHARDDRVVPVGNTLEVAEAGRVAGVPCEVLLFDTGGHGFGIARGTVEPAGWLDRFAAWAASPPRR